ncbi:MAG: thiopeptide-type bacteriocin biosynthesis protein [Dehalococcoidia bacterium]
MRKPPGLRLRFLGRALSDRLEPALVGWLEQAERRGLIRGFRFAVYEPEQFRFGGPAGMTIAHAQFDADSRLALRYEALDDTGRAALPRDLFSLVKTNDLFVRCVEDGAEVWDIWQRLFAAVGATVPALRDADLSRERDALYGTPAFTRALTPSALSLQQDAQIANADTAARLHAAFAAQRLTVGLRGLLADLTIFHWNRLGFTTADLQPLTGRMLRLLDPDGDAR